MAGIFHHRQDHNFHGHTIRDVNIKASGLDVKMRADQDIEIDGSTQPRQIDTGVMRFEQKPAIDNTRCITFNVDNNNRNNSHAAVVNFNTNGLAAGENGSCYDVNVDVPSGAAGVVRSFEVARSGPGTTEVHALHVDPGVDVITQRSGNVVDVEKAFENSGGYTDRTTAFNATGTDVEVFGADNDEIYWGMAAVFTGIVVDLDTVAGGAGIRPVFEFSDGAGGWTTFTPSDETQGFRQSGLISWESADLSGWAQDTVNGTGSKYWIRITRTRNALPTAPIEDTLRVIQTAQYGWDKDGVITAKSLAIGEGAIATGLYTPTITNVLNLDAVTAAQCQYTRIGDMVTVSGKFAADPTTAGIATELGISLPIASNFTSDNDLGGVAANYQAVGESGAVSADTSNDRAQMRWKSNRTANTGYWFIFMYEIK
jgi:hypothetical protein